MASKTRSRIFFFLIGVSATYAFGHPVSYQGATGVMTWNQSYLADYWATYSFRPDMAIAARAMRMQMKNGEFTFYMPQYDYLLKRWNGSNHQANVYLYGGFGGARFQQKNGTAGLVGIEADAESRKFFIMGKYEGMFPSLGSQFHHGEFRVGIAPYEAEYSEIASWLMIQLQYHPVLVKKFAITPLARFFYKNVLWETGVSLDGDWMTNLMFHF
jgi:hypothetical protein